MEFAALWEQVDEKAVCGELGEERQRKRGCGAGRGLGMLGRVARNK